MIKLKIITIVAVLVAVGLGPNIGHCANSNPYGCSSWEESSGAGSMCDGYWVHTYAAPSCAKDLDCALDDDDTSYAVCHLGYCMRRPGLEDDSDVESYFGGYLSYIGMSDTYYPCPSHSRCVNEEFFGCDGNYYPQPVTVHNQPIAPDDPDIVAINIRCLPCPQYNDNTIVLKSLDFDDSQGVWGITSCYVTSGEDSAGKYKYSGKGCQYSE